MNQRADVFAENVGSFLESNGFVGEKEKIYDTIASEYNNKIQQYSEYIQCLRCQKPFGTKALNGFWHLKYVRIVSKVS